VGALPFKARAAEPAPAPRIDPGDARATGVHDGVRDSIGYTRGSTCARPLWSSQE